MLLGKENSLVVVASLSAHGNRCVEIKVVAGLDERFKLFGVFQFRIAVQQQRSMVNGGFVMLVQLFQVFNEVMYSLRVKELRHLVSFMENPSC